jgi:hypothetical protein
MFIVRSGELVVSRFDVGATVLAEGGGDGRPNPFERTLAPLCVGAGLIRVAFDSAMRSFSVGAARSTTRSRLEPCRHPVRFRLAISERNFRTTMACQLCPQIRVYCCIAVSEVMGQ